MTPEAEAHEVILELADAAARSIIDQHGWPKSDEDIITFLALAFTRGRRLEIQDVLASIESRFDLSDPKHPRYAENLRARADHDRKTERENGAGT